MYIPLASRPFGMFSWMWSVFIVQYDDIAEQCGMDAVTTIRLFEFGAKISLVAVLNSVYLFPIYKYLGNVVVDDNAKEFSLSNLETSHPGLIATMIAAYIFFFAAMHFIDKDFEWLTEHRHKFLAKKRVQNYSIFLSCLPKEMQSDTAIKEYFRNCFSHNAVVDGDVALCIPKLEALVAKRNALISKFEHAINIRFIKGEEPMHSTKLIGGEKVESIPAYKEQLEELNKEISETIDQIVAEKEARRMHDDEEAEIGMTTKHVSTPAVPGEVDASSTEFGSVAGGSVAGKSVKSMKSTTVVPASGAGSVAGVSVITEEPAMEESVLANEEDDKSVKSSGSSAQINMSGALSGLRDLVVTEEGSARSAAFVTFADLVSANMALQSIHNHEPWDMVAQNAPRPDLVNWGNIGITNHTKQIGELISLALSGALCIFWTIPVAFVSSFSNVEGLVQIFPFLQEPIDKYPWFSNLMAQLAPLILVCFISILPYILLFFVTFEKPIEVASMQHPSLLSKLAAFTIIQTFFISTISGSLFESIQDIIDNPTSAVQILATTLPAQSAYFIQLIIVQNLLALGIELLRISPIAQEWLGTLVKKIFGYNLTEKERNTSFLGIRDIADPLEYYFGRELGMKTMLIMMVLYVYGCMSPITAYFTLAIFLLIAMGFRNQFIYVYPIANDSGGKLWLNFTRISITCMILAEIILCAVLFLKGGVVSGPLMIPLIVITILFDLYFKKRHYMVTNFLPLGDCAAKDKENEGMTYEWLEDAYLQPAMAKRLDYPDNYGRVDEDYAAQQKLKKELDEKVQMGEMTPADAASVLAGEPIAPESAPEEPEEEKKGCVIS
jgi:hypothetical protein